MLRWHRLIAFLSFVLVVYVIATGLGIEAWDLEALMTNAPPTNRNMLMMRQHIYGTPNYAVVSAPDYVAPALPGAVDLVTAIQRTAQLGHQAAPGAELRLVEVRGVDGHPAGRVRMGNRQLMFDLASGAALPASALPPPEPPRGFSSPRSDFKFLHRFNYIGQLATGLNGLAGMALAALVITGLAHYWKLLQARRKMKREAVFWRGGGVWRQVHRWVAICAVLPILWLAGTGFILSLDNFAPAVKGAIFGHPPMTGPSAFDGDFSAPMRDDQLARMARSTLGAFSASNPGTGIKVLQLRMFAGYAQGVVIGADPATTQHVYNTATGAAMSMTEPGYPVVSFPSGWEWHQWFKRLHRGDFIGLTGRWLDFAGGCGALYLLISGAVMYFELRRRRAKSGRREWVWK